jgi:hypothetical protein
MDYRLMAVSQKGRREQFINRWESTLSSGISNTDTTIPVVDGSDLPTEGDWRLLIGSEILLATARSGNNITAVRGQEGTTATSHSSAAEIKAVATAGGLQKFLLDNRGTGFTEESSANSVPLCRCLDQNSAILTASSFTWVNQGSATCTDSSDGGLLLTLPNEANFQFRGKLAFRTSSSGRLTLGACRGGENIAMWRFTNPTTFSATVDSAAIQMFHGNRIWIYGHDDGTNIKFRFSDDGNNWTREGTSWWEESRTVFMGAGGPDQIGFMASSGSGFSGLHIKLDSFVIEEL